MFALGLDHCNVIWLPSHTARTPVIHNGLKFLISDDHDLFRRGLRYALADGFTGATVFEAASFDAAMAVLGAEPDICLASFDLGMPGMDGGRSLASVRKRYQRMAIVVLSGQKDRRNMLHALEMGASGFIPKSLSADSIVAAYREVMSGRDFIPPSIVDIAAAKDETPAFSVNGTVLPPKVSAGPGLATLTPRQKDVLSHLLAGDSTKMIARTLDLAEGTVKTHLAAIFRLLDARNRVEALAKAISMGLVSDQIKR